MASLKESDFIRNGSVKKVMGLSKRDQEMLWESLNTDVEGDRFWEVNVKLLFSGQVSQGTIETPTATEISGTGGGGGGGAMVGGSMPKSVAMKAYVGYDKPILRDLIPPRDPTTGKARSSSFNV
jgi:hypothetical protein